MTFHINYGVILYRFREKTRNHDLHSTPSNGTMSEVRHMSYGNLGWWCYNKGEQSEDTFTRFDTVHERDRQTNRQTDTAPWHRPRYA